METEKLSHEDLQFLWLLHNDRKRLEKRLDEIGLLEEFLKVSEEESI